MVDKTVVVRLNAQTGQYQAEMGAAAASTAGFTRSVQASTAQAGTSVSQFGKIASTVGKVTVLGIAAGLALSAKAAIEFESSFAGIRKTVDASESQFERLSGSIRQMALDIPIAVGELNRIGELGGQLGVDVQDLPEFIDVIAKIGITTTLSVEEAALAFARLDNILGLGGDNFEELGSVLVELGNNFAATESEIITFSLRVAPIGATVGLMAEDVLALATAFVSVGVPAERGGTAVQKTFIKMAEAVADGTGALEIFGRVADTSGEQFGALFDEDPARAFQGFIEGLGRLNKEGKNVFAILDGLDLNNQRVISSLLALSNATGVLNDTLDASETEWEAVTALTEEAEKRFDTTASKIELAKNQFNDLAIEVGNHVIPAIGGMADGVGDFLAGIFALDPLLKGFIVVLAGIAAGAQIGTLAFKGLSRVIGVDLVTSMGIAGTAASLLRIALGGALLGAIFLVIDGLVSFGARQRDAEAEVRTLKQAIDAQRKSMEDQIFTQAKLNIVTGGNEQSLNRLGITLDTFAKAVLGDADALDHVNERLALAKVNLDALLEAAPIDGIDAGVTGVDIGEDEAARLSEIEKKRRQVSTDLFRIQDLLIGQTDRLNQAYLESDEEFLLRRNAALIESGGKLVIVEQNLAAAAELRANKVSKATEPFILQTETIEMVEEAMQNYTEFMAEGLEETAADLQDNLVSWDEWEKGVVADIGSVAAAITKRAEAQTAFTALITTGLLADASQTAKDFLATATIEDKASIVAQAIGTPEQLLADVAALEDALALVSLAISNELLAVYPSLAEEGGRKFMQELNAAVLAEVEGDPTQTTKPIDAWEAVIEGALVDAGPGLRGELLDVFGSDFAISFISKMTGLGEEIVRGLINGMESQFDTAAGVGGELADKVAQAARFRAGATSPSKVFMGIGRDLVSGLKMGIAQGVADFDAVRRHQLGAQVNSVNTVNNSGDRSMVVNVNRPHTSDLTSDLSAGLIGGGIVELMEAR